MQTVIEQDIFGEYFVSIPPEILDSLGWKEGDEIRISVDGDKIILEKKNDSAI